MTVFTSITKKAISFCVTMISLILFLTQYGYSQVIVKEDSITIPTYVAGKPDPMPRFYEHANHQGVQRRMYPYPFDDNY